MYDRFIICNIKFVLKYEFSAIEDVNSITPQPHIDIPKVQQKKIDTGLSKPKLQTNCLVSTC